MKVNNKKLNKIILIKINQINMININIFVNYKYEVFYYF